MVGRIVLDTGALFRPRALRDIPGSAEVVLPAVAAAERMRQLAARGAAVSDWLAAVHEAGFVVEPFRLAEASRLIPYLGHLLPHEWKRLARDALIAAHVRPDDLLWTTNPRDFDALGLPSEQIVAV